MSKKLLLIGGGGHCKSVLDSALELNDYEIISIIDKKENIGKSLMGISIIGCDDDLLTLFNKGYKYAFVTLGSVGNPGLRIKIFNQLIKIGFIIPTIVDLSAKVSEYSKIEQGVFIGKKSVVNAGTHINKAAIVNTGVIIEHDCQIGSFAHVSPGAVLGGGVHVEENAHVGLNATIKQQVTIGRNSIIGMGSVVLKDIQAGMLAYGNPCVEVKKN